MWPKDTNLNFLNVYVIPLSFNKLLTGLSHLDNINQTVSDQIPDIPTMAKTKGKKAPRNGSDSEDDSSAEEQSDSSADLSNDSKDSSSSDEDVKDETIPLRDDHGPPCNDTALDNFYKKKRRVNYRDVSCVINKKTFGLYFKSM